MIRLGPLTRTYGTTSAVEHTCLTRQEISSGKSKGSHPSLCRWTWRASLERVKTTSPQPPLQNTTLFYLFWVLIISYTHSLVKQKEMLITFAKRSSSFFQTLPFLVNCWPSPNCQLLSLIDSFFLSNEYFFPFIYFFQRWWWNVINSAALLKNAVIVFWSLKAFLTYPPNKLFVLL